LIRAVRIADIPRSKREEPFSHKFITCFAKIVVSKCWHGSLHDVESPAGETMLISGKCEEQVESKLFWIEVFDPLFGSQSVVDPCKGAWNLSDEVRNDWYEGVLQRHNRFSKGLLLMRDVHYIPRCMENRLNGITLVQKLKKLESFQLAKLSDLGKSLLRKQSPKSIKFTATADITEVKKVAETEVGKTSKRKKIQQINKFRFEGDSKSPSFVELYQPLR
jgi:hypothetical protein